MTAIHVDVLTTAPPDVVFALLRDTARWPEWSPMTSGELVRPAPGPDPEGVGARRRFTSARGRSLEEVVAYEPDRQLSYVLLEGLPLRDYRADVALEPVPDGTRITWRSTFRPKVPGTGWLFRLALGRFIGQVARGLGDGAARVTGAPSA